ncbi:MAG: hypothetical protein JW855_00890 [Gammaproteobacteria bacterium]|nr:hypothetical protein [Gammaproteobacteria bacterium]
MKQIFICVSACALIGSLSGCQSLNQDLQQVHQGLSTLTGQQGEQVATTKNSPKAISNKWHVSDQDAMAWLSHDNILWNNHGKLKGINWYTFWSQQIHAKTALAEKAYQYCHESPWSSQKVGGNCQTYFQAYSMTNSQESISWGDQRFPS